MQSFLLEVPGPEAPRGERKALRPRPLVRLRGGEAAWLRLSALTGGEAGDHARAGALPEHQRCSNFSVYFQLKTLVHCAMCKVCTLLCRK